MDLHSGVQPAPHLPVEEYRTAGTLLSWKSLLTDACGRLTGTGSSVSRCAGGAPLRGRRNSRTLAQVPRNAWGGSSGQATTPAHWRNSRATHPPWVAAPPEVQRNASPFGHLAAESPAHRLTVRGGCAGGARGVREAQPPRSGAGPAQRVTPGPPRRRRSRATAQLPRSGAGPAQRITPGPPRRRRCRATAQVPRNGAGPAQRRRSRAARGAGPRGSAARFVAPSGPRNRRLRGFRCGRRRTR